MNRQEMIDRVVTLQERPAQNAATIAEQTGLSEREVLEVMIASGMSDVMGCTLDKVLECCQDSEGFPDSLRVLAS